MRLRLPFQDMSSIPRRLNRKSRALARGFTLVELLSTIAILGLVSTALFSLIQSFYVDNQFLIEQTSALDSARRGVTDAISTMREATYGDDGSYPIAAAATSSVTVYADVDGDTTVEKVRYFLTNGTFYKTITNSSGYPPAYPSLANSTTTIATNVRNTATSPIFTFYDNAGTQLSTTSPNIAAISSVQLMLLVDINPNRAPNVFTLMQTATLRNLKAQ